MPIRTPRVPSVAILAGTLLAAPAAYASDLVACAGTEIIEFNPGLLLLTPQTVDMSADGQFLTCQSTVGGLTSAEYETTVEDIDSMSCLSLLVAEEDATTIRWNTGQTSHFAFHVQSEVIGGVFVVTYTGSIDAGLFAGALATIEVVAATPNFLQCVSSTGLTSSFGATTLTITDSE